MRFTVAVAQFAPQKARVSQNLDRIAEIVLQAEKEGAELVVFAETATTGYFLEGGVLECALSKEDLVRELGLRLGDLSRPMDVALGFYEECDELLYNSAAYIEFGNEGAVLKSRYQKFFLPTYGVFDEERFVAAGNGLAVFDTRLGRMGLLICEDIWHSIMPTLCAAHGAQILLVPSASPARGVALDRPSNVDRYERLLTGIAEEHALYCVNSALLGFEGGKAFTGGSLVVDCEGRIVGAAPIFEEHLLLAEIDTDLLAVSRASSPLLGDLRTRWSAITDLVNRPL